MCNTADVNEHLKRVFQYAAAAAQASGYAPGKLVLCGYGENSATREKSKPAVRHTRLGDVKSAVRTVRKWCEVDHRNVYMGYHFKREELQTGQRGERSDIERVFGICADIDRDHGLNIDLNALPISPTFVVVTSSVPHENLQSVFLFKRVVDVREAEILCWGLGRIVGDSNATPDVNHVWRLPFTLNWPNAAKVSRGRPSEPQMATLHAGGYGAAVDPLELSTAIARHLEPSSTRSLREIFLLERGEMPTDEQKLRRAQDIYTGNAVDLARIADACRHIVVNDYKTMFLVTAALFNWSQGADWGLELALATCRDGCSNGKHDPSAVRKVWSAMGRELSSESKRSSKVGVGTLINLTKGWDKRLMKWPGATRRPKDDVSEELLHPAVREVLANAREMPDNDLFHQAREAWMRKVAMSVPGRASLQLAFQVCGLINKDDKYAWPRMGTIANTMSRETGKSWTSDRVYTELRKLVDAGFLAMSPGNQLNARGYKGPMFALKPGECSWRDLIVDYRRNTGHKEDTLLKGLETVGSEVSKTDATEGVTECRRIGANPDDLGALGATANSEAIPSPPPNGDFSNHQTTLKGGEGDEEDKAAEQCALPPVNSKDAAGAESGRGLIKTWCAPEMLDVVGAEQLKGALAVAVKLSPQHSYERYIEAYAVRVCECLQELRTVGLSAKELSVVLRQHDSDFQAGKRDSCKAKSRKIREWSKARGSDLPTVQLEAYNYLASLSDKLSSKLEARLRFEVRS